ncbi:hypothetical protein BGZ76_004195 [Entomortierella beljakovae]|nr:hypothetical protein BGZ76_004195 [Entomortierella beljakovae]
MDMFLDWITDPYTYNKLNNPRPTSGQRAVDLYNELAKAVNDKHGTDWDALAVKSKIQYSKKKYDAAREITKKTGEGDTDEETLRSKVLGICPDYDRFHAIWGGSIVRNPPHSKEYGLKVSNNSQESVRPPESTEDIFRQPIDDSSDAYDSYDTASDAFPVQDNISVIDETRSVREESEEPGRKRRKVKKNDPATFLENSFTSFQQSIKQAQSSAGEIGAYRAELRSREVALDEKEKNLQEILMDREKYHQEMLNKRSQELEREKEQFAAKMKGERELFEAKVREEREVLKSEKEELREERQELKRERQELKQDILEFRKERDMLIKENSALKKEFEVRVFKVQCNESCKDK